MISTLNPFPTNQASREKKAHKLPSGLAQIFSNKTTIATAEQEQQPEPQQKKQQHSLSNTPAATISTSSAPSSAMSSKEESHLSSLLHQLHSSPPNSPTIPSLLSQAKIALLHLNALIPQPGTTPPKHLSLARQVLETGALYSIRAQNVDAFTRYFQQLQPFYELPDELFESKDRGQRSKITGLFLLLLLTKGDYAGFHTLLEGLEVESAAAESASGNGIGIETISKEKGAGGLEGDRFISYPVMLEQWLMEGAYDRVWKACKKDGVPGEEFAVFSEVLVHTIRSEIASCSEKAYPSLPITNAKDLLFLDSEGSVVDFAQNRGWTVRDGRIYFPAQGQGQEHAGGEEDGGGGMMGGGKEGGLLSGQVIENTIGYARELETIV
ncbi:regulatory particle non-ATPase [Bachmanniomyces sp. S44760]|nr:regulatory particle non-ATPase [Bachmanniomyces sp. S44760]